MVGFGHSWQAVSFVPLWHQESGGASLGNATSRSIPGQMVVDVGGERSIMARRAA